MLGVCLAQTDEIADRLKRLDTLRDAGAITDAEHAAQRTRILDALWRRHLGRACTEPSALAEAS
ncbi:SHOCT domain-containing protein [Streptomyces sp. NPDC048604]|uniref:SHOCT domain-containing protein n=1 Tax=Streptomyces sp. NPDC048604 TaxID=3365578 RepID=UPI00371FEB1F